jgi:hypothetical protein
MSLATRQLIRCANATIAATFGAFFDDCCDTSTPSSIPEILRNRSLSTMVSCWASVVELKSQALNATSTLSSRFKY